MNQNWISITEKLPEVYKDAIFVTTNGEILIACYFKDEYGYGYIESELNSYCISDVTHWMPLPQPPKESKP